MNDGCTTIQSKGELTESPALPSASLQAPALLATSLAFTLLASVVLLWSGLVFVLSRQTAVCLPFNPSLAFQSRGPYFGSLPFQVTQYTSFVPTKELFFVISFKRIYLPFLKIILKVS